MSLADDGGGRNNNNDDNGNNSDGSVCCSWNTYNVLGTVLSAFHMLSH